ncbi:MAG TPA: hypothetical protein VHU88_00160 [Sporichthyaceae bacterium]|jgi:hypothetical protein|nr:hypothetical protein [Sporichthyaceae bacterium]
MSRALELLARARRSYGAHPVHALLIGCGFLLCALALRPLLAERPVPVGEWFVSGAVLHDAVLLPLYVAADGALVAVWRRRPGQVAWLNFVRVPAAVSLLLLLVWFPLIGGRAASFRRATGRGTQAYLPHWLFVVAVLFGLSLLGYLIRLAVSRRRPRPR